MIKETLATLLIAGGLTVGSDMPEPKGYAVDAGPGPGGMTIHYHVGSGDDISICERTEFYLDCNGIESKPWAIYDYAKDTVYLDNDRDGDIDNIINSPRMNVETLMPTCK